MKLSLSSFIPYRLSVAANVASGLIARAYRDRFELSIPEWRLIAILAESERLTPQDLTRETRMDKIAVSRAAARLESAGLVARAGNPGDRRSHFLALTAQGRSLYREVAPAALELEAQLLEDFSTDERRQLEALLRRIEAAALARMS